VKSFYPILLDIVAYLLKARTVEPEKQKLLRNDSKRSECTRTVSRERLGKHVPVEKNNATGGL
jgi:hypothetical protein